MSRYEVYIGKKKSAGVRATKAPGDTYGRRLSAYFPWEIIALYTTLWGVALLAKNEINLNLVSWVIFGVGALGVIAWLMGVDKIRE